MSKPYTACAHTGADGHLRAGHHRRTDRRAHATVALPVPIEPTPAQVVADHEERLHEVRGSLAAVAAAVSALTSHDVVVPAERRDRIERMLRDEVERLQRLVAVTDDAAEEPVGEIDLDEVVETVVVGRRLTGHRVSWTPSGHRVLGRRDEVVEVLNILLVNAARHAPGAPAHVEVESSGDVVRLRVSDDGPGVPEHLRRSIFDRGARSDVTGGQGVGLSVARSLARGLGGTLDLVDDGHGASFALTLQPAVLGGVA